MSSNRFDRRPRYIRKRRIRVKISGRPDMPRLSVFRSNKHIQAQIIDDTNGITLVHASSEEAKMVPKKVTNKMEISELVGGKLGERAIKKGIKSVVFDRGGYKYHGRVKKLAEGARSKGVAF